MFRSIIVPIDIAQKEKAARMIASARQLLDTGGKVTLVNVVEVMPLYEMPELASEMRTKATDGAKAFLTDLSAQEKLDAEIEVHQGNAAMVILDIAAEKGADAIVIASHRPGLQDYFLGSTAARVVRHAPCSVLVLR